MPDYQQGKIYTIRKRTDDTLIYVGSTCETLARRLATHKRDFKSGKSAIKLYSYIEDINDFNNNWYIELFELYPSNSKMELNKREGEVIRQIGTINKNIAGRDIKQYLLDNKDKIKQYYKDNVDKVLEERKIYYQENKDKIKEQHKLYYKDNVKKIILYQKEYRLDNAEKLKEQKKQYCLSNTDKIKDKGKQYYLNNSDKIKEYQSNYRLDNADKIKESKKKYYLKKKAEKETTIILE